MFAEFAGSLSSSEIWVCLCCRRVFCSLTVRGDHSCWKEGKCRGRQGGTKRARTGGEIFTFWTILRKKANQSSRLIPKKSKYCQPNKKVKKEGNLGSGIKQMVKNLCTSRLLLTQIFHSSYFYHYPFLFSLFVFTISFAIIISNYMYVSIHKVCWHIIFKCAHCVCWHRLSTQILYLFLAEH